LIKELTTVLNDEEVKATMILYDSLDGYDLVEGYCGPKPPRWRDSSEVTIYLAEGYGYVLRNEFADNVKVRK
jgi:hypothetical protein